MTIENHTYNVSSYNYMGLVATETNEKNATRYYSYDALGRLVSKTDRNGRITTYSYDTIGRLTSENWSDTTNYFMYTYDAVGNLLYATDGQHSYSYAYDALNRPIYTTFNFDSQSAVFAYTYDLAGRRTASSLSLNGHSDRVNQVTYDFLGNATKIIQTGSAVDEIFAEFDYNANGLMTAVRRYEEDANDVVTSIAESLYTFNANNAVTSITHKNPSGTQIVQHSYTYDNTNNIVDYLNSIDGQTTYDYDFLGQLIGADYSNQNLDDETYTYDENGNRITANGDTYTTGTNNELTSDGEYTYTYDAEGNRISKTNAANTERELYTWDYRNRLTTVTKQTYDTLTNEWTTVQIVEYAYDYNNIWIRKTLDTNGDGIADSKTIFIPENYQTTVQLDDTDLTDATGPVVTHHYLWTPNQQDKLLADTTASGILWALTDHLGTIRDVLDDNSSTHLIYDAFGNLTSGTNPILFGYTGKAFDSVTQLQNNINRWYDATIGRWLSTDPIGFFGNDCNLYRYVQNRVLAKVDYRGLEVNETSELVFDKFNIDESEVDNFDLNKIITAGNCKIFIFIGHGYKDPNIEGAFGHFLSEYNKPNPDTIDGMGIYLGTVGCWSDLNNNSIEGPQQVPNISAVEGLLHVNNLANEMNNTVDHVLKLVNTLCSNRKSFVDDGCPMQSQGQGTEYHYCGSVTVFMIMYSPRSRKFISVVRDNHKKDIKFDCEKRKNWEVMSNRLKNFNYVNRYKNLNDIRE